MAFVTLCVGVSADDRRQVVEGPSEEPIDIWLLVQKHSGGNEIGLGKPLGILAKNAGQPRL